MINQPLLMSFEEAKIISQDLNENTLLGKILYRDIQKMNDILLQGIIVPGQGEAGGYEHNQHKQNYINMDICGRLFLITKDYRYYQYIHDMLIQYAQMYPQLPFNISHDSNSAGRLFHQTLNENMWLLYASCAYSCIVHQLSEADRDLIISQLFRPMINLFVNIYSHDFDIIHNHGLWSVAAVGVCGYVINDQTVVDKALYGLKSDCSSGGFLVQLTNLFSPDGYYLEGPYYHRFALSPIYLFAEAIERRQPEIGIYSYHDSIIKKTTYTLMAMAFPNGIFPSLNDASKSMGLHDNSILIATSICFTRYQQDPNLLSIAYHQNNIWVHISGKKLSDAIDHTVLPIPNFNWGSLFIKDGADCKKGGVSILRYRDDNHDAMALLWFGQHGSDPKYHSALDHGHYDGLHLSVFNRGQEVLHDYGFGRWVNIEPKFGGRYIPENDTYCKQTIAHNTVVVDQKTQNNSDTKTAVSQCGDMHFFDIDHTAAQAMSAIVRHYYPQVDMQRSVIILKVDHIDNPLVIDLFRLVSDTKHQYDYPIHYTGQIMNTNFDYQYNQILSALGEDNGYQHLWCVAQGKATESGSLISWLHGDSYYTMVSSANIDNEIIFARTGANDPHFNLRSEPVIILRQFAETHLFANVLETHGYFDESTEVSIDARGKVIKVTVLVTNDLASIIRLFFIDGHHLTLAISNQVHVHENMDHHIVYENEVFNWKGAFAII